jgi:hypothetical protein
MDEEITKYWWQRKLREAVPLALILALIPLLSRPLDVGLLIALPLGSLAIYLASQYFYAWLARRRRRRRADDDIVPPPP